MPRPPSLFLKLSPSQEQELRDLEKHPRTPKNTLKRLQVILLNHTGVSVPQIAQATGRTEKTVYKTLHNYQTRGLNLIFDPTRPGRVPAFTPAIETHVLELIAGETAHNTASITDSIAEQFNTVLTTACVYYHLRRLGLTWQRTRYVVAGSPEVEVLAQAVQVLKALKKGPSRARSNSVSATSAASA